MVSKKELETRNEKTTQLTRSLGELPKPKEKNPSNEAPTTPAEEFSIFIQKEDSQTESEVPTK